MLRHTIDLSGLTADGWQKLYTRCCDILDHPDDYRDALRGRTMASLFFEPSTRTSFSFQAAMLRMGGGVFGFSSPGDSSVSKGETLKDTVIMCSGYCDAVVMRHPRDGAAKAASLYSRVPVINAGDGRHLHPTQTLTDLTAITRLRGRVGDMNIGICGDLKNGRTVHSLIQTLSMFEGITYYLIAPRELSIPGYLRSFMERKGLRYVEVSGLEPTMPQLDVLYMTRLQRERFANAQEYERFHGLYILNRTKLQRAKKDLVVLHPLPRTEEISPDVDSDPRAGYFEQARLGMYVRMALLLETVQQSPNFEPGPEPFFGEHRCDNPNCITAFEPNLPLLAEGEKGQERCGYCEKEFV